MHHCPDGDFNYIGHVIDSFSKFNIIFPLKTTNADEVAQFLQDRVLAYLGPPKIFYSDHGSEYVDEVIETLSEKWGGDVNFINGCQNQQSQEQLKKGIA